MKKVTKRIDKIDFEIEAPSVIDSHEVKFQ